MSRLWTDCYIGLGSNLAQPRAQLRAGLAAMNQIAQTRVTACSSLYRSRPLGPQDQPDYLNAVAALETRLSPANLLAELIAIEEKQGRLRRRERRWGPRTLDLDILIFGTQRIETLELRVPHPGLSERSFVLYPLAEIAPDLQIPGLGSLRNLLERCPPEGLERLERDWA